MGNDVEQRIASLSGLEARNCLLALVLAVHKGKKEAQEVLKAWGLEETVADD